MNRKARTVSCAQARRGCDAGSAAVEAAIVLPLLIMFLCMAIAGGRIVTSGAKIDAAAQDAAREASLARTAATANTAARAAAAQSLNDQGIHCTTINVSIDIAGLAVPLGQVATVSATVACTVPLSDLLPGIPGNHTLTATASSILDQYRQRALRHAVSQPAELRSAGDAGREIDV